MNLQLVSFALCPFVHRSAILLGEKGVPFETTYIDLKNKPAWFLAISPRGKVPVLVADSRPIFESLAINEFLDETTPPRIFPEDPFERARQRGWIEVANDLFLAHYELISATNDAGYAAARAKLDALFTRFEETIARPFFTASFGFVDVAVAPAIYRLKLIEASSRERFFEGHPACAAWAAELAARPTVKRGVPADFDALYLATLRSRGSHLGGLLTA